MNKYRLLPRSGALMNSDHIEQLLECELRPSRWVVLSSHATLTEARNKFTYRQMMPAEARKGVESIPRHSLPVARTVGHHMVERP